MQIYHEFSPELSFVISPSLPSLEVGLMDAAEIEVVGSGSATLLVGVVAE